MESEEICPKCGLHGCCSVWVASKSVDADFREMSDFKFRQGCHGADYVIGAIEGIRIIRSGKTSSK